MLILTLIIISNDSIHVHAVRIFTSVDFKVILFYRVSQMMQMNLLLRVLLDLSTVFC